MRVYTYPAMQVQCAVATDASLTNCHPGLERLLSGGLGPRYLGLHKANVMWALPVKSRPH